MIAFFESIGSFIKEVVDFVVTIFNGFIRLAQYIGIALTGTTELLTWLPADLAILGAGFIAISVVYLIIGRE